MSKYCYEGSAVLINKFDVRDITDLDKIERNYVSVRDDELRVFPRRGDLLLDYYKSIHKHLFQDMYTWNGQLRDVPIARNGVKFCPPEEIEKRLDTLLKALANECYLMEFAREIVFLRLAYYLGELNNIHPFRDGNGRTQRSFVEIIAKLNGLELDFGKATKDEMVMASRQAENHEYSLFEHMIEKISTPMSDSETTAYRQQVLSDKYIN